MRYYKENVVIESHDFNWKNWLLVISFILAPMTGLRVAKVGPAEFLCILWIVINLNKKTTYVDRAFLKFWLFFLFFIFLGSIWGQFFYPNESSITGVFSWIYFAFISIFSCSILNCMDFFQIDLILKKISIGSTIWYFLMYLYSQFVSNTFLGAPLWYGGKRFSGGGTNPHQVALLLGIVIIFLLHFMFEEEIIYRKLVMIICAACAFFLLILTESSTGLMAVFCGAIILLFEKIVCIFKNDMHIKFIFCLIILSFLIIGNQIVYSALMEWISSDGNGLGRLEIFSSFDVAFWKNPIFGLGPGAHGLNGTMELHNTYLEIIAMSGCCGFLVFLLFTIKLVATIRNNIMSLAVLLCMYIFGLAGFGARRLVYWMVISLLYIYSVKLENSKSRNWC